MLVIKNSDQVVTCLLGAHENINCLVQLDEAKQQLFTKSNQIDLELKEKGLERENVPT